MKNNWPCEIVAVIILTKTNRYDVASGASCADISIVCCHQALFLQVVIKLYESRMLHYRQRVDVGLWGLVKLENSPTVITFNVCIIGFAPHQSQASPYQLLQQNRGLRRTKRNEHTDVVYIETLAKHEHRDNHLRAFIPVYIEELLFYFLPFFIFHLALLVAVYCNDIFVFQAFSLQKLLNERRHSGVLADDKHFRIL